MFKGLKSKLEDEAKKLQASVQSTVAQYGESISQQVGHIRSAAASDAGSENSAGISRRFFGLRDQSDNDASGPSHSVGGALMEEVTEGDLLGLDLPLRERTYSGGSNHSNESSFSTLFPSVPGMPVSTLDPIDSDIESTMDEHGSAVVNSASKEQISSVLRKLQGRAANYKDKYRDLVKQYNEVVTENNKCRTVLAQTQDKALTRIEKMRNEKKILLEQDQETQKRLTKYEDMLKKCTEEIRKNRAKIAELTEGSSNPNRLDQDENESDRVSSEWKTRIEKLEEDWTERLNKAEADAAITLAQSKADMHAALETKDREVEVLRQRCRTLEVQDGQANERWQKKVDELKGIISSLETEKSEMIEKLSEAKVQGVKAVRDEEEARRNELEASMTQMEKNHARELAQLREDLQKLQSSNDQSLQKDTISLEKVQELTQTIEKLSEEHKREIEGTVKSHYQALDKLQKGYESRLEDLNSKLESFDQEKSTRESLIQELQYKLENSDHDREEVQLNFSILNENYKSLSIQLENAQNEITGLENQRESMNKEIQETREALDGLNNRNANATSERETEIINLREMLKESTAKLEKAETAHGNLKEEIQDIKRQRDILENKVSDLEMNLDQAQNSLEEEKRKLEEEKVDLENEISRYKATSESHIVGLDLLEECLIKVEKPISSSKTASEMNAIQLENEQKEIEKSYNLLQQDRDNLEETLNVARTEFESLRKNFEETLNENRDQIRQLEEANEQLKIDFLSLQHSRDYMEEERKRGQEEFMNRIDQLDQDLTKERNMKKELEENLEQIQAQRELLARQLDQNNGDSKTLEKERDSLREELDLLRKKMGDQSQEYERKIEESLHREQSLQISIVNRQKELEDLKKTEEIVFELRKEVTQIRSQLDEANKQCSTFEERSKDLENQLVKAQEALNDKATELEEEKRKLEDLERKFNDQLCKKDSEHIEELKIREQYSTALESLRRNEELLGKKIEEKEDDNRKLSLQLEELTKTFDEYREQYQKEQEQAINEIKRKAEIKLNKMKKEFEKDVDSSKSELLLKVDEHQSALSEKEKRLDELRIEKAKLEQALIGEEEVRRELYQERQVNEQIQSQLRVLEEKLGELSVFEKDSKNLQIENDKLREEREMLLIQVSELESSNEEALKRITAKQDIESKKMIRDLQREVKQLYAELTDKSTALDEANSHLQEIEEQSGRVRDKPIDNHLQTTSNQSDDPYRAQEEIDSLKRRLTEAHQEIDFLRENKHSSKNNNSNSDEQTFAHPTEQEYLRNVLYRYMHERETLGKEIVTLARVIGTVTRFSKKQLEEVLAKEESRAASWSQTLSGVSSVKH